MSIYSHIPYTYLIGWTKYNKWYYGLRFAKGCNPTELWKTYFTSSEYVKQFRTIYGEPDIIQVRKTFNDKHQAMLWEYKVLKRLKVSSNMKWLNLSIHKAAILTEETIKKIAIRAGLTRKGQVPWNKGKKIKGLYNISDEERARRSIKCKELWANGTYDNRNPLTEEGRKRISEANKNKVVSSETRRKLSENKKAHYAKLRSLNGK